MWSPGSRVRRACVRTCLGSRVFSLPDLCEFFSTHPPTFKEILIIYIYLRPILSPQIFRRNTVRTFGFAQRSRQRTRHEMSNSRSSWTFSYTKCSITTHTLFFPSYRSTDLVQHLYQRYSPRPSHTRILHSILRPSVLSTVGLTLGTNK